MRIRSLSSTGHDKHRERLTVGNGPNQLAVSDDGQFLYVGLDGDKKVAQVSLPAGTVNFTAGLGTISFPTIPWSPTLSGFCPANLILGP